MVEHQEDPSSLLSTTTEQIPAFPKVNTPCDLSHRAQDPASVPLPPSPPGSPVMSPAFALESPLNVGPGESGGSGRASSKVEAPSNGHNPGPVAASIVPVPVEDVSQISFEDFATRYHQNQRKHAQRKRLENRLRATKVSIGVSARMVRVGLIAQRGLVEALRHDDKASFVALYHTLQDLQEPCSVPALNDGQTDSADEQPSLGTDIGRFPDFLHQLSPQSRTDFLEILRLVRSDPQFLVDRLQSLSSSQLAAFTSPATALDTNDPTFPSTSRARAQSFLNRSAAFKDHAYAFERTDPLSILLFNVFAAPLDAEMPESRLRLEVWSSVCAQLISNGSSRFYPLIGQILSSWTTGSTWKARPKFELYLMDILQTGAFLLEPIATPPGLDFSMDSLDPMRTDVAEEFFASAVDDLFRVLDDLDGGFPHAVLQFAKAVLRKLDNPETRRRFLEFLFLQWFFSKFLYHALTYPETHGLLLDFHIRKDAREKLLNQIGHRAYAQVFAVLRSMHHFSIPRPIIKGRLENMLSRFQDTIPPEVSIDPSIPSLQASLSHRRKSPSTFLMMSALDVLTLLDTLFHQTPSSLHSSPASTGVHSWPSSTPLSFNLRPYSLMDSEIARFKHDTSSYPTSHDGSIFSVESRSIVVPENSLSEQAARIRFELTDLDHPNERLGLEHPSDEHWTIFSVAADGHGLTWSILPDSRYEMPKGPIIESEEDAESTTLGLEENHEALQTAIIRLVKENLIQDADDYGLLSQKTTQPVALSLKQRFNEAMFCCHHASDFVGAHYWWNASRQLGQRGEPSSSRTTDDSWILGPMHENYSRSLTQSRAVIERCESDFVSLDHSLHRLQTQVKDLTATFGKIRDKMWYMSDVKNSIRYEEAKHVAMALKTMIYSARLFSQCPEEQRSRYGARSLGGSLFQKPEVQVMNMMKAPSSQGGPNKLSDEQVELTQKWLSHNGIDNFCKGEERIHRFCYEVQMSINKLVGETMAETPVLWASELFQRERSKYEGYGSHKFPAMSTPSTPRPSTTTSEDTNSASHFYGANMPMPDPMSRLSQDTPSLGRKPSIQSIFSDKWRPQRDLPLIDISSLGCSPSRAASTSTGDTYSTFWSAPQRHPVYAASASSVYSRPPSMFSETATRQLHRVECKTYGKTVFMDNLRQTLTSLLLSDLGSPVWSCGSETDAWFTNALDQKRIQVEMRRRASVQKFYVDHEERSKHLGQQRGSLKGCRSRSLDNLRVPEDKAPHVDASSQPPQASLESDGQFAFSYKAVFHRLIEMFSRHGNPFVKLNALRDLRSLVVASLIPLQDSNFPTTPSSSTGENDRMRSSSQLHRVTRHSFSEVRPNNLPQMDPVLPSSSSSSSSSPPESITYGSHRSDYSTPSEAQIVATLRDLILEVKPKTLFRDLQFISAFVPGDQLNKTDRGTAFLQFGLAALSLKEEICHSMVEIADRIVFQELSHRHPPFASDFQSHPSRAIQDAAGMWIITAKEGNPVAQRELAILYLTHPELLPRVTLPLTLPRDTFKAEMMYRRDKDSKSDPQSMCLALHWMQLSANGGDNLARNRLREREEFDSIA
ncbi:Chromatin assembly factor 1 subunit A [Penicillium digitatum]|nr:Chromatin assembly factor 1 subunit A [Penicillium digitatum]